MLYHYFKSLLILSSFFAILSCKTSSPTVDPYTNLTIGGASEYCKDPAAAYPIPVMGKLMLVTVHDSCLGHENIFIVNWPGKITDIEKTCAKLLALMYVGFKLDTDGVTCVYSLLKYDTDSENILNAAFYSMDCANSEEATGDSGAN